MTLLCDHPPLADMAAREVLWEAPTRPYGDRYSIVRVGTGWEPAGAACRWTDGYVLASVTLASGVGHGQRCTGDDAEERARTLVERWYADRLDYMQEAAKYAS